MRRSARRECHVCLEWSTEREVRRELCRRRGGETSRVEGKRKRGPSWQVYRMRASTEWKGFAYSGEGTSVAGMEGSWRKAGWRERGRPLHVGSESFGLLL